MTRRAAIAGLGATMTGLAGCLDRPWSLWERDSPTQISVDILAPPEDDSIYALRIARHLADNLEAAGIQSDVFPTRHANFLREVLINNNFDMYVWRHPPQQDPDDLRPLLHSQFSEERGWQNPYGFSNSIADELLEEQLRAESRAERIGILAELQELLISERPYIPITFEVDHRLIRRDRIGEMGDGPFHEPAWISGLEPAADVQLETLQLGTIDGRLTQNLNPIAVEYRGHDGVLELVYESLGRRYDDALHPWLAREWEWTSPSGARRPTIEIELREGLSWHDDEPLTSEDVVFTYEFLQDTSMTDDDPQIPSPRYRGPISLVDTVEAANARMVRIQFVASTREHAAGLLSVPILPSHIWGEWTGIADVAGIPVDDTTTEALVESNLEPIGSGPYRVEEVVSDDLVRLSLIEDHPFVDVEPINHPIPAIGPPEIPEIVIDLAPSVANITESIRGGAFDGAITNLGYELASDARGEDQINSISRQTSRLFHVGFNLRENPLSHAGFRRAIETLVDRVYIRDEIFQDSPRLTRVGIFDEEFVPDDLQWQDHDANRFAGEPGTGEVDVEEAREQFRDAGFSYSEDGDLLVN